MYKFKSDKDFEIATKTICVAIPFILEEIEPILTSKGYKIVKRYYYKDDNGDACPVLELEKGDIKPIILYLKNAIDETIFVDRDAELKEAIHYTCKAEIYENAQRILLDKVTCLELTEKWSNLPKPKEPLEAYMRKNMPSTSHIVRAETREKGEKGDDVQKV